MTDATKQQSNNHSTVCEHSGGSHCPLIDDVARSMAYAYWRGRLESIPDGQNKEVAIAGFGNSDAPKWKASAKALLSMNGHISANAQDHGHLPAKGGK
jgi:hypothetical protein